MFRVLFVCTGNICRSPMAELMLRQGLGDRAEEIVVASAGTAGLVDVPMEPFAVEVLRDRGIDGTGFRSKGLQAFMVESADLVLTATRDHRAAAATLSPRSVRRLFTIREFDRLTSALDASALPAGDPAARARALVEAAAGQRGLVRADKPRDDDVIDPYRGPRQGFVDCAALLSSALARPLALLTGG